MKRLILIEFNELCPHLLEKWMASGELPNFAKLYAKSEVYVTTADEPESPNLEPWIQWYSVHTGMPFSQHRVFHLTDGPKANNPDIWQILSESGISTWNCGSMNARACRNSNAYFLPDPWCGDQPTNPAELSTFADFVSTQVKEYSNSNQRSSQNTLRFLWFLVSHGLGGSTVLSIVKQLIGEISDSTSRWKRAAILDKLQFDVFRYYFRKFSPQFSTFFVNSTAHFQHSYWRHMIPDQFFVRPDVAEIKQYGKAILFGYQEMDKLVARFMELANNDVALIFATALSQQPYLKYEQIGGHHFYRPRSIENLMSAIGAPPSRIEPVMTHQFVARFCDEGDAADARNKLAALRIGQDPVFGFDEADNRSVFFGCQIKTQISGEEMLDFKMNEPLGRFFDFFYQIEGTKSGRHHPDGCLWISRGVHRVNERKVSILDIAPTVMDYFGQSTSGFVGSSLIRTVEETMCTNPLR